MQRSEPKPTAQPTGLRSIFLGRTVYFVKRMSKILKFVEFTPEARELWGQVSKDLVFEILRHHWCTHCQTEREMTLESVEKLQGDLLLIGICRTCGGEMRRVFELS
jgi:hypothetical protein